MDAALLRRELLPFAVKFAVLLSVTLLGDIALHHFNLVWLGRYLGIPGTILIVLSLLYSMRKHKLFTLGSPKLLLLVHEIAAILGILMVLIHSGIHLNAILPWLATFAMVVNMFSGMIGRYLLDSSRRRLAVAKEKYERRGLSKREAERELFWDAVSYDMMSKWRVIHFPISYAFAILAGGHILSILMFWD